MGTDTQDGSFDFALPSLGADMDTGKVLEWCVEIGDTVERGDILADQIEAESRVDSIAKGIEDRGDLVRHVVGDGIDIVFRDRQKFGECARPMNTDTGVHTDQLARQIRGR